MLVRKFKGGKAGLVLKGLWVIFNSDIMIMEIEFTHAASVYQVPTMPGSVLGTEN